MLILSLPKPKIQTLPQKLSPGQILVSMVYNPTLMALIPFPDQGFWEPIRVAMGLVAPRETQEDLISSTQFLMHCVKIRGPSSCWQSGSLAPEG